MKKKEGAAGENVTKKWKSRTRGRRMEWTMKAWDKGRKDVEVNPDGIHEPRVSEIYLTNELERKQ